jgi:hypothetical protein
MTAGGLNASGMSHTGCTMGQNPQGKESFGGFTDVEFHTSSLFEWLNVLRFDAQRF